MLFNAQIFFSLLFILFYFFKQKFPLLLFIPLSYILLSGLVASIFPQALVQGFNQSDLFTISNIATRSLLFVIAVSLVPRSYQIPLPGIIAPLILLNSIYMLIRFCLHLQPYGIGLNSSMDGTILAFTYPLVIAMALSVDGKFTRALILTIPILAVFASTSSVGIGGICLSITLVLLKKRLNLKFLMIPVLLFLVAVLVIPHIFSDSLRFIMWKMAMSAWSQQSIVTQLFGTGLGTYSILGPMIQLQNHFTSNGFYIWMHNDWLQCMFELGYVGFTIILIYSILILRRAYKKSAYLFSSLATFFVVAGMNYPTKAIPSAIIMILLIKMALDAYDI